MPPIETAPLLLVLWAAFGYLLGSIPFGILITRAMGLGNLREIGSGNIGTTNVLRTGSKGAALATLLLDGAKGAVAALIAWPLAGYDAAQLAGFAAFLGHCFPPWLGFRGGKGVATFLGLLLALAWPAGIAACLTWLVTALLTRISSFAAITAASFSIIWVVILGHGEMLVMQVFLTLVILWRHRENIARIKAGTEPRIGRK
ncbi:glycerol-3-phosphate 1-O-acyltransferase PlsY [Roseovarius sp. SCSIO 43702]|uniref:glycerol-3-phosphate 1-O-acyltransferase PlsY n=1 Tax=Roseovarius sp. SCSIO 43702 TaxID=2823043 RepID=UPI001C72D352|nr:glycerol-3-phosphate 1-O-acyltransferase PlsY [Roseovarius sp. SCSIO 43702]QYX57456.1 glycerol-3-phosphate 1-O-acyltransferase PlsY [Roseovarius sp. SCSIO 43702]